jgi:hypothetical protein
MHEVQAMCQCREAGRMCVVLEIVLHTIRVRVRQVIAKIDPRPRWCCCGGVLANVHLPKWGQHVSANLSPHHQQTRLVQDVRVVVCKARQHGEFRVFDFLQQVGIQSCCQPAHDVPASFVVGSDVGVIPSKLRKVQLLLPLRNGVCAHLTLV